MQHHIPFILFIEIQIRSENLNNLKSKAATYISQNNKVDPSEKITSQNKNNNW